LWGKLDLLGTFIHYQHENIISTYARLDLIQSGFFAVEQVFGLSEPFKIFLPFCGCRCVFRDYTSEREKITPPLPTQKGDEKNSYTNTIYKKGIN